LPTFIASDPAFVQELREFAEVCTGKQINDWVDDAEKNLPRVESHTTFGVVSSELKTSEGWRKLSEFGIREGYVNRYRATITEY